MAEAIFIVGYYRSGTSALSGALSRLGVKFHNDADPNEHNPLGFYEIPELIDFDVALFARLGVEWTDVRGLPEGWAERPDLAGELVRLDEMLRRRFGGPEAVFGLKHPHLCRNLAIYERAVRQAGHEVRVIHMFRDPWTAAASQAHKNGLTRAHALLLWLSYATSAERNARHLRRSWLTYHELLEQPAASLQRVVAELGLSLTAPTPRDLAAASAYLTGQLNRSTPVDEAHLLAPLRDLVTRCWAAIVARQTDAALWDGFAAQTAELVGFLSEVGASRGRVIPALGGGLPVAAAMPVAASLRPPERADAGARLRLERRAADCELADYGVVIAAPAGRAAAVSATLEALRGQWRPPAVIEIVATDALVVPGITVHDAAGGVTAALCAALTAMSGRVGYVAALNAGDIVEPDAGLRFALAAVACPVMLYCDEVVPRERAPWVRRKPGWDVTRLRQAAYLGDWVWYRGAAVVAAGGFAAARAGAEEYDMQLRLAEVGAAVVRVSEPLFVRDPAARRDDIAPAQFCAAAAAAVTAHLARIGQPAAVQQRQFPGLFHHVRETPDVGTTILVLCDGVEIPDIDRLLTGLLSGPALSGPVILLGAALSPPMQAYMAAISEQRAALEGKVLAVPPPQDGSLAGVLGQALALVETPLVALLDARASPPDHWAEALRARLADPHVVLVGARALVALDDAPGQFSVQGPIVIGADTRMGAGHRAEDPGPGGWLLVDQEVSAVAPSALLGRCADLRACTFSDLEGDALWIDLCAQLRAGGGAVVWTPDVSFIVPAAAIVTDAQGLYRTGSPAARALPGADPYHHPALSLHGNLLADEQRGGLLRGAPADPACLLVSGGAVAGEVVLNAARALRGAGHFEAGWAPEPLAAADVARMAPGLWVRVNPVAAAAGPYVAVYSAVPAAEAGPAIAGAAGLFATSPALVKRVRKLTRPGQSVALWRPALSGPVWAGYAANTTLNTRARVLWVDEGDSPDWWPTLMEAAMSESAWIVVERDGAATYPGAAARLRRPTDEQGWAAALAEVAPQIMVRPAQAAVADCALALMAAAAGCLVLVDERLDMPAGLGAVALAPRVQAWAKALSVATGGLADTLARGAKSRAAVLALPRVEAATPGWVQGLVGGAAVAAKTGDAAALQAAE
jgi:hypothetical protein